MHFWCFLVFYQPRITMWRERKMQKTEELKRYDKWLSFVQGKHFLTSKIVFELSLHNSWCQNVALDVISRLQQELEELGVCPLSKIFLK